MHASVVCRRWCTPGDASTTVVEMTAPWNGCDPCGHTKKGGGGQHMTTCQITWHLSDHHILICPTIWYLSGRHMPIRQTTDLCSFKLPLPQKVSPDSGRPLAHLLTCTRPLPHTHAQEKHRNTQLSAPQPYTHITAHTHTHMHACAYACARVRTHTHIYTHTLSHTAHE